MHLKWKIITVTKNTSPYKAVITGTVECFIGVNGCNSLAEAGSITNSPSPHPYLKASELSKEASSLSTVVVPPCKNAEHYIPVAPKFPRKTSRDQPIKIKTRHTVSWRQPNNTSRLFFTDKKIVMIGFRVRFSPTTKSTKTNSPVGWIYTNQNVPIKWCDL